MMKKLINLLILTLLCVSLFGQGYNYFKEPPLFAGERALFYFNNALAFTVNGKDFMVSYDTCYKCEHIVIWYDGEKRERNLYLFRRDSTGWKIACDEPLQTDYMKCDSGIFSYVRYYPMITEKHNMFKNCIGKVTKSENGNIEFQILNLKCNDDSKEKLHPNQGFLQAFYKVYTLKPIKGDKYEIISWSRKEI